MTTAVVGAGPVGLVLALALAQRGEDVVLLDRDPGPDGVFFVGDAVSTTNPSAGRGITLGLQQAGELLQLLTLHDDDRDVSAAFDAWCSEQVRPWFEDHVQSDASILRSYAHDEVDPEGPLSSNVIAAAADADPSLAGPVMAYGGMVAPPGSLAPLEPRVRELLREGWRPQPDAGPSRDELIESMRLVAV